MSTNTASLCSLGRTISSSSISTKDLAMIGEFAFTPSVFDEEANPDSESWREQLRELGSSMFPRTAGWPVMVANLYAGSWHSVAGSTATSIKESKARVLCETLLDKIGKVLVQRPHV